MLRCATASTYQVDDPEAAAGEIAAQLEAKLQLLDNTVAIVYCDPSFVTTGAVREVCRRLPYPTVGYTTSYAGVDGEHGTFILTVMALTSDDTKFHVAMTGSLETDVETPTLEACAALRRDMDGEPKVVIAFPPMFLHHAGDAYVKALDKGLPGAPVFGTLQLDDDNDYTINAAIVNGESSHEGMSLLVMEGGVSPRFYVAAVSQKRIMPYTGEITRSDENTIYEINDMTAREYFNSIGIFMDGGTVESMRFIPFLIDLQKSDDYDGVPIVRGLAEFGEHGSVSCRGTMYQNSILSIGICDSEDITETNRALIETVNALPDASLALYIACVVRKYSFAGDPESIVSAARPGLPYMLGYSAGEICPTSVKNGKAANRFHNYTLVAMVL